MFLIETSDGRERMIVASLVGHHNCRLVREVESDTAPAGRSRARGVKQRPPTLVERVATLEAQVAELKEVIERLSPA